MTCPLYPVRPIASWEHIVASHEYHKPTGCQVTELYSMCFTHGPMCSPPVPEYGELERRSFPRLCKWAKELQLPTVTHESELTCWPLGSRESLQIVERFSERLDLLSLARPRGILSVSSCWQSSQPYFYVYRASTHSLSAGYRSTRYLAPLSPQDTPFLLMTEGAAPDNAARSQGCANVPSVFESKLNGQ